MRGVARLGSPDLAPIDRVVSVLDLRMLGAVEAVDSAGHGVKLGGTRQRGLLALLALSAPNMVATDTIVEALSCGGSKGLEVNQEASRKTALVSVHQCHAV